MDGRGGGKSQHSCMCFPGKLPIYPPHRPSLAIPRHICVCANDKQLDLGPRNSNLGLPDCWTIGLVDTRTAGHCVLRTPHCASLCASGARPASRFWEGLLANGEWRMETGDWRRHLCSSNIVSQLKLFATCCVSCFITHEATNVCWRRLTVGCARSSGAKGSG